MTHTEIEFPFRLSKKAVERLQQHPKYWCVNNETYLFKPELTTQELNNFDQILRQNMVISRQSVEDEPVPQQDPLQVAESQMKEALRRDGYYRNYTKDGEPIAPTKELSPDVLKSYRKRFKIPEPSD